MTTKSVLLAIIGLGLLMLISAIILALYQIRKSGYPWPDKAPLKMVDLRPPSSIEVLDANSRVLDYWNDDPLLFYRPLRDISPDLSLYVVTLEDDKFYQHRGFDIEEIKKSIEKNREMGRIVRGGSTISQQLVKNLFLDNRRNYLRKFFEVPWVLKLESSLSKKEILELYLNIIEWGPNIHGAEAAARYYFDKTAKELSKIEAMYLALIVPSPLRFDLHKNPVRKEFLKSKKANLIQRLVAEKKLSADEASSILNEEFPLVSLDQPSRRFPANRDPAPKHPLAHNDLYRLLEKNLSAFAKSGVIQLTLQFDQLIKISSLLPIESSAGASSIWAYMDQNIIRALRIFKHAVLLENAHSIVRPGAQELDDESDIDLSSSTEVTDDPINSSPPSSLELAPLSKIPWPSLIIK